LENNTDTENVGHRLFIKNNQNLKSGNYEMGIEISLNNSFRLIRIAFLHKNENSKLSISDYSPSDNMRCNSIEDFTLIPSKWPNSGSAWLGWFLCKPKYNENVGQLRSFTFKFNINQDDLISFDIYFVEQCNINGESICGTPDIPIGVIGIDDSNNINTYDLKCKDGFKDLNEKLICDYDMKWSGNTPKCFTLDSCEK